MNKLLLALALGAAALAGCRGPGPSPVLASDEPVRISMGVGGVT